MPTISNTLYKLKEAEFFLDKLEPHKPYFDFYLSAFLNASRSTTWVMRNEYNKNSDWENWFENTTVAKEEKLLLSEINKLRIQSTKQNGIKTEYFFLDYLIPDENSYSAIEKMHSELTDCEVIITISESTGNKIEKENDTYVITGKVKMERDKSLKSREELYDLCEKYYQFLKIKVKECTKKFIPNR